MRAKCTARLCKLALTHRRRSRSWRRQSPRQSRRRPRRRRRQRTRRTRRRRQLRKRAERRGQTTRGGRAPGDARERLARQQACTHHGGQPRWQRRRWRHEQIRRARCRCRRRAQLAAGRGACRTASALLRKKPEKALIFPGPPQCWQTMQHTYVQAPPISACALCTGDKYAVNVAFSPL